MDKYIALQAIQTGRKSIEPRTLDGKVSGLFDPAEFGFTAKQVKNLLKRGVIRETEGTEDHEKPTRIEDVEQRVIEGTATAVEPKTADPLDLDNKDGAGGSIDDLDQKKVAGLKKIAADEQIDLGAAADAAAMKQVIRAARAAKAAPPPQTSTSTLTSDEDLLDDE